ncbi:MAG: FeoB-associated Cys-rich membrane protein [Bacteroidales bacterium]|nr:FeoB-associated Cys-rich membrane protein [Bacteroidales bacterium]MBQ5533511.1 FeoB-associated Cys-rich membrane protein [Bacteroidales bacterium]
MNTPTILILILLLIITFFVIRSLHLQRKRGGCCGGCNSCGGSCRDCHMDCPHGAKREK